MNAKTRNIIAIIVNVVTIVLICKAMSQFFIGTGDGNMQVHGLASFKYFTNLSNWFAAFAALLCIPFEIRNLKSGSACLPRWVYLIKFYAAVSVTVTFLTCVFFLGPINILILAPYGVPPLRAYAFMFAGVTFILHLVAPLLSIISVLFIEKTEGFDRKYVKHGVLSVFLYAIVYIVMVALVGPAKGGWTDFYHFTFGGRMYLAPVSAAVMLFATWLISKAEWGIYKKVNKE